MRTDNCIVPLLSCLCTASNGGGSQEMPGTGMRAQGGVHVASARSSQRRGAIWRSRCSVRLRLAQGAADWPNRTVRIIVNFGPGGSADNSMRPFADRLSRALGQQFVIDNRGGASGALGLEAAVKSPPDGYTFRRHALAQRRHPAASAQDPLRSAQGPRARHPVHGRHAAVRGAPLRARQLAARACGLCQEQPRQAGLGHCRGRLVRPSHVRGIQAAGGASTS
jgi:hypothetical protein